MWIESCVYSNFKIVVKIVYFEITCNWKLVFNVLDLMWQNVNINIVPISNLKFMACVDPHWS
jgi:hypothetical protein